jgi:hypothetical protein
MMMPSIKYGQENFTLVLDNVLKWCSIEKAAAASNIDSWTIGRWRIRSENGDEPFQEVEYRGLIQPFHIHFEVCILNSTDEIESNFRANARDGYFRPIIWHGEYQYEPDEAAEGMSTKEFADALDLGLAWPDKKRRTFNEATGQWERVKMMEWIAPSVDAQMKILSSWSDKYADKRSLRIDGNINQTYGVTVMGTPLHRHRNFFN